MKFLITHFPSLFCRFFLLRCEYSPQQGRSWNERGDSCGHPGRYSPRSGKINFFNGKFWYLAL